MIFKINHLLSFFLFVISSFRALCLVPEGEYTSITKKYTLQPDGSITMNYSKELKINSLVAVNQLYGKTFIMYNSDFQQLKINTSYTRLKNGEIQTTPPNAFNEVLPASAANAPAFNQLKEMVITHTGLEPGATIYLDYTVFSTYPDTYKLDIDEFLQEESPVKSLKIIIDLPANQKLNYYILNQKSKPHIETRQHRTVYTWSFKNISPRSHELFQPKHRNDLPRFIANTYPSQPEAVSAYYKNFNLHYTPEIKSFTQSLIREETNELDKALTIQQYIIGRIAPIPLPPAHIQWKIRPPEEVFRTAYGTIPEKINLFLAMLKAAGLNASLAMIFPEMKNAEIKGLNSISDLLVYVQAENLPLFLPVTSSSVISPELREKRDCIYLLSPEKIRPLTILPGPAGIHYRSYIRLNPLHSSSEGEITLTGGLVSPVKKSEYTTQIQREIALPEDSVNFHFLSLQPYSLKMKFSAFSPLSFSGSYLLYPLTECRNGINQWPMEPLYEKRETMLEIPYAIRECYDYTLELTSDLKLKNPFRSITLNEKCGNVRITFKEKENRIYIHKEINLFSPVISPQEYKGFRKLVNLWRNENYKTLIINKLKTS